jgi:hypothetical protein
MSQKTRQGLKHYLEELPAQAADSVAASKKTRQAPRYFQWLTIGHYGFLVVSSSLSVLL